MSGGNDKFERDFAAFLGEGDPSLSALYRKLPQAEPDARLDAAVLAMAHRALNPELVATPIAPRTSAARRRARWIPALSAAATAVFAIGVAVKLGPRMWTERQEAAPAAAAHDDGVVHVRTVDAPKPAPEPPASPPPPSASGSVLAPAQLPARAAYARKPAPPEAVLQKSAPPPAPAPAAAAAAPPIAPEAAPIAKEARKKVENVAPVAPQPFPAPATRSVEMDAVERKEAIAEGAWQRLHENETPAAPAKSAEAQDRAAPVATETQATPPARASAPSAPAPALAAQEAAPAPPAREAPAPQASMGFAPTPTPGNASGAAAPRDEAERADAEKAPALADKAREQAPRDAKLKRSYSAETLRNSHLYPESWMAAIQRLIRAGRGAEARENLDLFREKYPDYALPADVARFARETP